MPPEHQQPAEAAHTRAALLQLMCSTTLQQALGDMFDIDESLGYCKNRSLHQNSTTEGLCLDRAGMSVVENLFNMKLTDCLIVYQTSAASVNPGCVDTSAGRPLRCRCPVRDSLLLSAPVSLW